MAELQDRLQRALGDAYRIERELGGGGMGRVFLAEETALQRRVVIKVLPPETAADVNVERFRREIQLAARLQHPHVVPLLAAGSEGDLLWYVMPYIEGESLRVKLAREGELPIAATLRILRDVVDALAYAHRHGVVHRDIKPDNVLLSEGHALVTDFGVAKAVSEAVPGDSLTSLGVALGTPAYMAPEQAAGNPHVDHRADLYALGATAYEMLCGRPPFAGPTAQAVLAAHLTEAPEPVTANRAAVPAALNVLVLRCLEKLPADRWQQAAELLPHLEALLTPSGGTAPATATEISSGTRAAIRRGHPLRVTLAFGAASVVVLAVVYLLVLALGLPEWVFAASVGLLVAGLPIMLLTGQHERERAAARASGGYVRPAVGLRRFFTWRNALAGGAVAFAALGVATAAYMGMRALGIGPVGTLLASGVLEARDRLLVAAIENRTADSTLGPTVTELLRVGLAQSPVVRVMGGTEVGAVLGRMQRAPETRIDQSLALEIAQREGLKVVVSGEITAVGNSYALSARLLAPDGQVLTAQQESAPDADGIIAAVGRLSGRLRERIGESLRHIRSERLEQVTTGSLEALRLYTEALRAQNAGDAGREIELLEEAVRVDTAFAMAYRRLGAALSNRFERRARMVEVVTKAYEHRDRLPERERYQAIAFYHMSLTGDAPRAISAYQTLLDRYPGDHIALNNLGVLYEYMLDAANAEKYYRLALESDSTQAIPYGNVIDAQVLGGKLEDAARTAERFAAKFPGNPSVDLKRAQIASVRGDYGRVDSLMRHVRQAHRGDRTLRATTAQVLAWLAALRGRLTAADSLWQDAMATQLERGLEAEYLRVVSERGFARLLLADDPDGAVREMDEALRRYPLDSLAPLDRPLLNLAELYAMAGRPERARQYLTAFERSGAADLSHQAARQAHLTRGVVALAEGEPREAIASIRGFAPALCRQCWLSIMARAFDAAGAPDSAITYYRRYIEEPFAYRLFMDYTELPLAYRRLGELYEAQGEREQAVRYYNAFVELWQDADAALGPQVTAVKERMARLVGEGS